MKKIIFFTSSHKIGLTGQLTDFVCSLLKAGMPQDSLLCVSGEKEQFPGLFDRLRQRGVTYFQIQGLDEHHNFTRLVKNFASLAASFTPDIVHVQTNWQLALATAARFHCREHYAVIYTVHGYRHNYKFRSFMARYLMGIGLFFFADKVITPSSFLKKKFGFVKDKAEVIYLGVENDLWSQYPPPEFAGTKRLIFPGEFRQGKNQDTLIRTLKAYIDRTGDDDIELYLPGQGEKLEHCKSLSRQLGIEAKVHFPGFIDRAEMLRLYMLCQYAVIPSNVETFGLCITEPYILGRVVISRHVGVADDLITDGETGFFFDTEEDLLEVLADLFTHTEKCTHVSRNAYKNRGVLSWEQICDRYLKAIDSLGKARFYAGQSVVIIWQRFLPYHVARLRHLQRRLEREGIRLSAVEVASRCASYGFPWQSDYGEDFEHICCFPGASYHDLSAEVVHDKVLGVLNGLMPDVVFAPATPVPEGMAAVAYRLSSGKRIVMMDDAWEHTDRRFFFVSFVKRIIHRNIDAAFVPAPSHRPYYERMGFPGDRIIFGVDVVDNDYFYSKAAEIREDSDILRKTHGIPQNYFLFVGRFLFRKGLTDLLKGYMKYRKSADKHAWDLMLVGGGKEEKLVTSMAKGMPGVHFAGPRYGASLCRYYALASALVIASISDQWGLVINEGMALGLPIIASRGCGAARTLVRAGENGWTFEPGDTDTLSALMARMSSLPPGELRHMGERSQEIISAWSLDRFAEGVLEALTIPRRPRAGLISDLAVRLWKGRVRTT